MSGETISVPVIRATAADTDVLSDVIAAAFHDLAPSRWLIADPAARRDVFPGYFRLYVEHAMADGLVHTTPGRDAVALWLPAGHGASSDPPGYGEQLAAATAPWTARFLVFDQALQARHPAEPAHDHLAILAVLPGRQSHGTGTTLLRARHRDLDDTRTLAYLEASSPRARELYLRHGYSDDGPPVCLPGGPWMWPMVRQPCPASTAPRHEGG